MRKSINILLIISIAIILFGFRLLWLNIFSTDIQPEIKEGQLDLRGYEGEIETINLDGEWKFYPNQWLSDYENEKKENETFIKVPGDWSGVLQEESESSFGYGSYHLQILVDPEDETTYSLQVSSVRSASELYVNGRYLGGQGELGEDEISYKAKNLPFTASFTADEGVIDIVIQAANFKDTRGGGLVRSMRFGKEQTMQKEMSLSTMLQQAMATILFIHAIYSIILYFMDKRDKALLYFSLFMFSLLFISLFASEDKVLYSLLPLSYEVGFKLVYMFWALIAVSLLSLVKTGAKGILRKVINGIIYFTLLLSVLSLLLPVKTLTHLHFPFITITLIAITFTFLLFPKLIINERVEKTLLNISLVAVLNQMFWVFYFLDTGIKVMYYPFDIAIALFCLASIWFRRSSRAHIQASQLAKQLRREDELKDEFLANTSHELRNPLHSILNMLSSIVERNETPLQSRDKHAIETALQMGRHMSYTLNDLLDMMHLKDGTPRLNKRVISLSPIVTGLLDMLHFMVEGKQITFKNKISTHLPDIYADENRVIQIMFNLLHNAVKYTDEGKIVIEAKVEGDKVRVIISDTGIGMDKETVDKIFEPYERASGNKLSAESGVGIGLTISKQLVQLQGGEMTVSSRLGEGSQFSFTLPVANVDEQTINEQNLQPLHAVTQTELQQTHKTHDQDEHNDIVPNVLVIDDEPVNLQVIEMILHDENYNITSVTSGEEALKLIDLNTWDLVISDVMMPNISGYELTRLIRKKYSVTELPVLLLTARSQSTDIETGFLAGANDYITKPVEPLELRARVDLLVKVKKSIHEQLKMEAAWLQAQIQPHFLFNTLNSITALSEIDLDRMRRLIDEFAHFLRSKFQFKMIDELHPIKDELNIVKSYLFIEQVRFTDRLQVEWELEDLKKLYVPLLTIQPLVENAIQHGLMTRHEGGTVTISVTRGKSSAKVSVTDDGVGMDQETVEQVMDQKKEKDSGIGLMNTHLRLKRYFGEGITVKSKLGKGTTVSFNITYERLNSFKNRGVKDETS